MQKKDDQKQQEAIKDFFEKNTHEIELKSISDDLKSRIQRIFTDLNELNTEVDSVKNKFNEKTAELKDRLVGLAKSGKITIDKEEQEKNDKQLAVYEKFLNGVDQEVKSEISFLNDLLSENPPKTLRVFKGGSDDSNLVLENKIKTIKQYVKKMRKDLRISFSKYDFGLSNQIKNLIYLEAHLRNSKE